MDRESGSASAVALVSTGGYCPPLLYPAWTETVRVRNPIRRWWFRRTGWSTEWTLEHEPINHFQLFRETFGRLPTFTAMRGGIDFSVVRPTAAPLSRWQKRRRRWERKLERRRERLAYRIAPTLRDRDDDF